MRRRTLLRTAALLPPAAAAGSGCAFDPSTSVRFAVPWSGTELRAFRRVLAGRPLNLRGLRVDAVSLGDDITAALRDRTAGKPDVVMLPSLGQVRRHRADLRALPADLWTPNRYAESWEPLLWHRFGPAGAEPALYAVPFKVAHKSVIWYRREVVGEEDIPTDLEGWLKLNRRLVERGVVPLALPAADTWPLTDLFENLLLGADPEAYDRLANASPDERDWRTDPVRATLARLGELVAEPGVLLDGPSGALARQFPEAMIDTFHRRRAAMVFAPDFAESVLARVDVDASDAGTFPFPAVDGRTPLVVGGDLMVLSRNATDSATRLVRWLTGPHVAAPWAQDYRGFISANRTADPAMYSANLRPLAQDLADDRSVPPGAEGSGGRAVSFDLSDQIDAAGDQLGRTLQAFLAELGAAGDQARGRVSAATDRAIGRLTDYERARGGR